MALTKLKHFILIFLVAVCPLAATAQSDILTLEECYQLAKENYPSIKKLELIDKSKALNIENANKGFLPQLSFSGQATYQSEVTSFSDLIGSSSINGIELPSISKDQYKVQAEINQLLYDGGKTRNEKTLVEANSELQKQNLETNLYTIKDRINSIFFAVLLMDAQLKQNDINKSNLQTQVQKTEAQLANGVAFRSNVDELKAEIVNTEMKSTEFKANRSAYLKMLSLFIGKEIPVSAQLQIPHFTDVQSENNRPELKVFDSQNAIYDVQEDQIKADLLPKVNAFFQGAYGRPTLNMLNNSFGPWYLTGIKFTWPLAGLYTKSNRKEILQINRRSVEADRETFLFNSQLDLTQQDGEMKKYAELIQQDNEMITLRESVTRSAEAQLNNGVITTHEYIQKVNAENLAKQTRILHDIQLLQAKYKQKFITGN